MKPEILAPAGSPEKLRYAIAYGADAVYLGGTDFGLRVAAAAFDRESMLSAVKYAHAGGVKVYVTLNIFAHNRDIEALPGYIRELVDAGVDAVIVSDPGVFSLVRELAPNLKIHVSTQANTTNWRSARVWESMGADRIVLARELSRGEIKTIRDKTGVELEAFVHGAMCMSYSGRCLLSNYMTGRDANRGDCAQACRWKYRLVEEKRPGEFFPFSEDDRGSYILSSRDLCLLEYLPDLLAAGVTSFKIEGRVKSVHYVATITRVYRQALDECLKDPDNYQVRPEWLQEISKVSNRDYTTGFFTGTRAGNPPPLDSIYRRNYTFVGVVRGYAPERGWLRVEQRNRFVTGEELEILTPGEVFTCPVHKILDEDGNVVDSAPHPQQTIYLPWPRPLPEFSLLRRPETA
ncbi:putative protease [Desulfotomaculum arcticum]|uniref:Putative protease n=1 Tax=Desulfotruncus arcticus DSM 17038 TaxID=1121424 RepID=A0A1I2ZFT3_9FIRM|nr:U32 family peptidase [Desulfotruncus arcticus]SFH35971.1 putative protease [Desulfotomaculum arcticum] [Desulfotruncus arcticus DSM 17038]